MKSEKRMKVLVIHHDVGASCAYSAIARSGGLEAFACEDTADVIAAIQANDIDVLILDYDSRTGFEPLRQVCHAGFQIPAILITAHEVDQREAMNLGVKVILTKPPDLAKLRGSLAALSTPIVPVPDIKVLFQFLERCEAAHHRK